MTRARILAIATWIVAIAGCRQPMTRENVPGKLAAEPSSVEASPLGRMLAEYLDYVHIGSVSASFERGSEGSPGGVHPVRRDFDRAGIRYFLGEGSVFGIELWVPPDCALEAIEIGKQHSGDSDPHHFINLIESEKPTLVLREHIKYILESSRKK